ncbi:MAG: YIP1 family protein [Candidatus Symbiothrix sp.]|jgi:hypothetical protein|nr:YIP1 family protein [Candidatus Symbiothrix sp.]
MDTLSNIIVNPVKAFNQLKEEDKFPVTTFIVLLALVLINMILNVPITAKVSELVLSGMSLSEEQADMAIRMTHKMRYLSMVGGFVMYVIMLFVYPLILFVIARIFGAKLNYTKTLRLLIYCFIATAIGDLVNTAFVYFQGIDNIKSMYDTMMTGVNRFTSIENAGIFLYMFLGSINPFQIWLVVLLVIGVKIFTDSGWSKSFIVSFL